MTLRLRSELIATAQQMSALGLTPGMSGNASVRTGGGFLITPSGMPYDSLRAADAVEMRGGSPVSRRRTPSTEWRLHAGIYEARPDVQAIVHTHSLFCTSVAMLRRALPAVHYMVVLAGADEIPCAPYATFGTAELAESVASTLHGCDACLLANHGMVAVGPSLPAALRLAAEVETLASQYWHASQLGTPHVLGARELADVRARFAEYGQKPSPSRASRARRR